MSKTSARQSRKEKLARQRQRVDPLMVSYEAHALLKLELERVSAVLADLIEEQKGAAVPAREVVSWVRNPDQVKALFDASRSFFDCPECDASVDSAHLATCAIARAWFRLGLHHHHRHLEHAWTEALQENNRRTVGLRQPLFPSRRNATRITGLFDTPPNTDSLRGYRDRQLMLHPRDLQRVSPTLQENGIGQFDGIAVVASDLVRPGEAWLINPADFVEPRRGASFSQEQFGPGLEPATHVRLVLSRLDSDRRGLAAVEDEARDFEATAPLFGFCSCPIGHRHTCARHGT